MSTLVIIPAYNEEESIVSTVQELIGKVPGVQYVVVNDGSLDSTAELCKMHNFNLIDLPVNLGLTGAFQTGMKYAYQHGFERAIQFDADGQHDPRFIPILERRMQESNADIVIGSRFIGCKKPHSLRMLGSNLISTLIHAATGTAINDPTSGMRLYNKSVIELFSKRSDLTPEPETIAFLIKRRGMRVVEEQVTMRERTTGESYLTPSKAVIYMANACSSILFSLWFRR